MHLLLPSNLLYTNTILSLQFLYISISKVFLAEISYTVCSKNGGSIILRLTKKSTRVVARSKKVLKQAGVVHNIKPVVSLPYQKEIHSSDTKILIDLL